MSIGDVRCIGFLQIFLDVDVPPVVSFAILVPKVYVWTPLTAVLMINLSGCSTGPAYHFRRL